MNTRVLAFVAIAAIVLAGGWWLWRSSGQPAPSTSDAIDAIAQDDSGRRVLYWYDPMAPQQRFEKPGKSPFMDMQLVPKYADEASDSGIRVTSEVQQNLGIRVAAATRASFGDSIVAAGRIEANERQLYALPSRVSGYVERLHVRAVGDRVSAGEKVAEIYSPQLLSAQQEFLALLSAENLSGGDTLIEASRRRLRLLGMAQREIEAIERSGEATARFGVYSPANGFVVELAARQGGQIQTGAMLLAIADLSSLWFIADVPERDAMRIRVGDDAEARLESAPGETFSGVVDFIYPTLTEATRTVQVRIVAANEGGRLRPGMFAKVTIASAKRDALAIPSEAVIYSGSRSVVIVKQHSGFRPAEVQTGAERGGRTEILAGLAEGEQVVVSGQFLLDSEASLSGALARLSQTGQPTNADEHAGYDVESQPRPERTHDHGESMPSTQETR